MNHAFSCNVVFMISVRSSFHSDSHGFVSFDNTSVFCLVFSNVAAFPCYSGTFGVLQGIAAGIGTHP